MSLVAKARHDKATCYGEVGGRGWRILFYFFQGGQTKYNFNLF